MGCYIGSQIASGCPKIKINAFALHYDLGGALIHYVPACLLPKMKIIFVLGPNATMNGHM